MGDLSYITRIAFKQRFYQHDTDTGVVVLLEHCQ